VYSQPVDVDRYSPPPLRKLRSGGPLSVGAMAFHWFQHPKYVPTRERLIQSLTSSHYRFRRSDPVVFLCGGEKSVARDELAAYLKKFGPSVLLFYAEYVWELIESRLTLGALKMESDLAALADLVIIIVESPGTFAELGAFSNSDALRPKILPIIDDRFKPPQRSFLALGPIRWIEAESRFAPPIYVSLSGILAAVGEIEDRISRVTRATTHVENLGDSVKHLLLFLCDLVAVIHPASVEIVHAYCERILTAPPTGEGVATLLALARALGLLEVKSFDGQQYFFPATVNATARPFHHVRLTDLPALRAEHVSALLSIPQARSILEKLQAKL
jgi:hypothetical protein